MRQIETFVIDRFRGIQGLKLEELGQINLLVGDNNSGKTSVLEALSLYADPLNERKWREVASSREVSTNTSLANRLLALSLVDRLTWLFPQQESIGSEESSAVSPLLLATPGFDPLRSVIASYKKFLVLEQARYRLPEQEKEVTVEHIEIDVSVITAPPSPPGQSPPSDIDAHQQVTLDFSVNSHSSLSLQKKFIAAQLIHPFSHRLSALQPQLWSKVIELDLKDSTLELLRSYDPKIQDIDLIVSEERRLILSVKHQQLGRAPLSTFGDGLRRIFTLATAISQCRNGFLLVDELETAIHTTALRRTFTWLVDACLRHNIQLFATTHSLETIDAVIDSSKDETVDLVAYRLEQREKETGAIRFDKGLITRLREDLGMEIR